MQVVRRAFHTDWSRVTDKATFLSFMRSTLDIGTADFDEAELEALQNDVYENYPRIVNAFEYYSVCAIGDGYSMSKVREERGRAGVRVPRCLCAAPAQHECAHARLRSPMAFPSPPARACKH